MSNDHIIRPSSIEGIKQLAKRLKKSDGIQHAVALDKASKAAGFENYKHAIRGLALQLLFCFEVCALSDSLVSSTPE